MKTLPYGTWPSPIAAADLARSAITLSYVRALDGVPYWLESRPAEGGRYVIVRPGADGGVTELTPPGFNARTRVHEYGGVPYVLGKRDVRGNSDARGHGAIYFANFTDQRLYAHRRGDVPVPLTPEGYRYTDFDLHPSGALLYCVREDHTASGEPKNAIVSLPITPPTSTGSPTHCEPGTVLFGASDFVAYPRISPDGKRLAWIAWNHPDMPWDSTTLYVADLADGALINVTPIAGGPRESVLEPAWDADGTLYFVSDRSDWWNLYRWTGAPGTQSTHLEPVLSIEAEVAGPLWVLGLSNYALTGDGRAVLRYGINAQDKLGVVDLRTGKLQTLDVPFSSFSSITLQDADTALAIAASQTEEAAVVRFDLRTGAHKILRAPGEIKLAPKWISRAEAIEFPTDSASADPKPAGRKPAAAESVAPASTVPGSVTPALTDHARTAHAFFYPPVNADVAAPAGEKPPLVVKIHGGPTSHSRDDLSLAVQFWTTRGFAVLDVNHGGSSGFGRQYRERLDGNWGIVDVRDAVAAVKYLAAQGRVDINRAAIRGGSAGGFTVLSALAFHDVFKAGANYYGVSDLEALAADTHKFESRYLDRLVAPLPAGRAIYEARAPIRHLDGFNAPLITFQGSDDKVVPPSQSRAIVSALEKKGVRVEYIEFEGEQHGFRKAENIVRSLEAELAFYGSVFGFVPAASPGASPP
jgi:dipeptidyl aminopeptidase/acylaminoacyl peptidase